MKNGKLNDRDRVRREKRERKIVRGGYKGGKKGGLGWKLNGGEERMKRKEMKKTKKMEGLREEC